MPEEKYKTFTVSPIGNSYIYCSTTVPNDWWPLDEADAKENGKKFNQQIQGEMHHLAI